VRIGIVGGGLQGLEAAYLAGKAGWQVRLLDRRPEAPARGLAGSFAQGDAADPAVLDRELRGVDLVLPALEDAPALEALALWAGQRALPLAFDLSAYSVTSSKRASNRLFHRLGLAQPRPWPECGLPVLVKPDGSSGSRGVQVFREPRAWQGWLAAHPEAAREEGPWVLQEYLEGPSYSIEVLGSPGAYRSGQVTGLDMDAGYDCKRVRAPAMVHAECMREMERTAVDLAEALKLRGLMDLEAIQHGGRLKLLEIDARLPSQTPIAVFWSTGYNMVEALAGVFLEPAGDAPPPLPPAAGWRATVLEHLRAAGGRLEVTGEHVLARRGGLRLERDFYGAEEAITDYAPGREEWVATLIVTGANAREAWSRRQAAVEAICRAHGFEACLDPEPPR
jgi:pyrrolysine biosynthesis protein PylC